MKYMIRPLEAICVNFLLEQLDGQNYDPATLFAIFRLCVDWSVDKRLMEKCMTILRRNLNCLIKENGEVEQAFLKISQECLIHLLEDDFLEAREVDLFKAVCFYGLICPPIGHGLPQQFSI